MNILLFSCKVYLRNCENKISIGENDSLKVYINAVREKGKANKVLIETIANCFQLKKYQINILSGLTTTNKLIQIITDKTKNDLLSFLS